MNKKPKKHVDEEPKQDVERRRKFREALKEVNRRYGRALKRLADQAE